MLNSLDSNFRYRFHEFDIDFVEFMDTLEIITSMSDQEIYTLVEARTTMEAPFEVAGHKIAAEYKVPLEEIFRKYNIKPEDIAAKVTKHQWLTIFDLKDTLEEAIPQITKEDISYLEKGTHSEIAENIIYNRNELAKFQKQAKALSQKLNVSLEELGNVLSIKQMTDVAASGIYKYAQENNIYIKYSGLSSHHGTIYTKSSQAQKAELFSNYARETGKHPTEIPGNWWDNAYNAEYYEFILDIVKKHNLSPLDIYDGPRPNSEILKALYDNKTPLESITEIIIDAACKQLKFTFDEGKKCSSYKEVEDLTPPLGKIASLAWGRMKEVFKAAEENFISYKDFNPCIMNSTIEASIKVFNIISEYNIDHSILNEDDFFKSPNKLLENSKLLKKHGFEVNKEILEYAYPELIEPMAKFCEDNGINPNNLPFQLDWDIDYKDETEAKTLASKAKVIIQLAQECNIFPNEVPKGAIRYLYNTSTRETNQENFHDAKGIITLCKKHNCPFKEIKPPQFRELFKNHDLTEIEKWLEVSYPLDNKAYESQEYLLTGASADYTETL
jgi:hypothetical protein